MTLEQRSEIMSWLEKYSMFLTKNGYMDTDWKDEPPTAIDEFMKDYPVGNPKKVKLKCDFEKSVKGQVFEHGKNDFYWSTAGGQGYADWFVEKRGDLFEKVQDDKPPRTIERLPVDPGPGYRTPTEDEFRQGFEFEVLDVLRMPVGWIFPQGPGKEAIFKPCWPEPVWRPMKVTWKNDPKALISEFHEETGLTIHTTGAAANFFVPFNVAEMIKVGHVRVKIQP